jgi:hypothetical protein
MNSYAQNTAVLGRWEETAEATGDTAVGRQTVEVFDRDDPLFWGQGRLSITLTWSLSWTSPLLWRSIVMVRRKEGRIRLK